MSEKNSISLTPPLPQLTTENQQLPAITTEPNKPVMETTGVCEATPVSVIVSGDQVNTMELTEEVKEFCGPPANSKTLDLLKAKLATSKVIPVVTGTTSVQENTVSDTLASDINKVSKTAGEASILAALISGNITGESTKGLSSNSKAVLNNFALFASLMPVKVETISSLTTNQESSSNINATIVNEENTISTKDNDPKKTDNRSLDV